MSELSESPRSPLQTARVWVVKIGSSSLLADGGRFERLASDIAALKAADPLRRIVLVSSGAIALGRQRLGMKERPKELERLQAAAAVGQSRLVRQWEDAFEASGTTVAQVLLTHADFADRERYGHASRALEALLDMGALPIINENDTVAVEEISFGDNDQLAAMVASMVGASVLVLLTEGQGLEDDKAQRISCAPDVKAVRHFVRDQKSALGTGGMDSKLTAAEHATFRGVSVLIASAKEPRVLERLSTGEDLGTLFLPHGSPLASRKYWIRYTIRPKGAVVVDAGAVAALRERNASLLSAGIVGVRGDFSAGDAVIVEDAGGNEVGRGLCRIPTEEVARLARTTGVVVIHRDDFVVEAQG